MGHSCLGSYHLVKEFVSNLICLVWLVGKSVCVCGGGGNICRDLHKTRCMMGCVFHIIFFIICFYVLETVSPTSSPSTYSYKVMQSKLYQLITSTHLVDFVINLSDIAMCALSVALNPNAQGIEGWTCTAGQPSQDVCTGSTSNWGAVTCSSDVVTGLLLGGLNLVGSIPVELGLLTSLSRLQLQGNAIAGSIPTSIGKTKQTNSI